MSVTRIETYVYCLEEEKGGYLIREEKQNDTNKTFLGCTVVIGSNGYHFEDGVLVNIVPKSGELELCDTDAAKVKHDLVMKNFRDGKCPVSVTRYYHDDYYTIHPNYISSSSLLRAAKLRQIYPDKTIYFQGKEYPKYN